MPAGQVDARDARRWRLTDSDAVVDATRRAARNVDLVVDFEHQTQHSTENGQPGLYSTPTTFVGSIAHHQAA